MMMRSSKLWHRGGHSPSDAKDTAARGSPSSSRATATASPTNTNKTLLPLFTTTKTPNPYGDGTVKRRRHRKLNALSRLKLVHRHVYVVGLSAIMLVVVLSSMPQLRGKSSSSSSSSLSSSSSFSSLLYSPVPINYPSSVKLYNLPNFAGLPVPRKQPIPVVKRKENVSTVPKWKPNYGGLDVRMIQDDDVPRIMYRNGDDLRNSYVGKGEGKDKVSWYYLVDDVVERNPALQYDDEVLVEEEHECRPNAWEHDVFENCNTFHEFDFQSLTLQGNSEAIGAGYYRDVFKAETDIGDTIVLKENSWENAHGNYTFKDYHFVRKDGIVAGAVQPHSLLVDTFGFCGLSFFTEIMPHGDVSKFAIPSYERGCETDDTDDGYIRAMKKKGKIFSWEYMREQQHLSHIRGDNELIRRNNLTATKKLTWALEMAESIALLNNHERGVIVHDDVQLVQWLLTEDGEHLKLNDFNRAEVMLYDETNGQYCKYRNNPGNGDWRAPEEYHDYPLDEGIDMWSLGNNFYSLLTGLPPFPEECKQKVIQKRIKRKETSRIDPRWRQASFAEGVLVHVIERCWKYRSEDRITIGELVKLLRTAVEENKAKQHQPQLPQQQSQGKMKAKRKMTNNTNSFPIRPNGPPRPPRPQRAHI